jgi:hypothetical protein
MTAPSSAPRDEIPSRVELASQINTGFSIGLEPGKAVETTLVSLDEMIVTDAQENYTLTYRAPADAGLPQGLYRLAHEVLGSFDLFLVPVKADQTGLYLEAVINRLIKG